MKPPARTSPYRWRPAPAGALQLYPAIAAPALPCVLTAARAANAPRSACWHIFLSLLLSYLTIERIGV